MLFCRKIILCDVILCAGSSVYIYMAIFHLFYNISVPSCFLGLGMKDEG